MSSTIVEIKKKIESNSREKITYIHPVTSKENIAKLVVAYSNTNGGDIILGIRDNSKRLEIKNYPFTNIDLKSIKKLISGNVSISDESFEIESSRLYRIAIKKVDKPVKFDEKLYQIDDLGNISEMQEKKIFVSYCWNDELFANLIDNDFSEIGYTLSRDKRDIKFKGSIKEFMKSIGKHDHVISIISNKYLKSVNCMYEISEVMRSREYKDKMLLVILKDSDVELLPEHSEEINGIAANIYSYSQRIEYIKYWENEKESYLQKISSIKSETNKIESLQELKRIENIERTISGFLADISDWNNTDLKELKRTNYAAFINEIV